MRFFLISFAVMLLAVAGMAVGVLLGRRPIKGSCGGINNIRGLEDHDCEICGRPASDPCDDGKGGKNDTTKRTPTPTEARETR